MHLLSTTLQDYPEQLDRRKLEVIRRGETVGYRV